MQVPHRSTLRDAGCDYVSLPITYNNSNNNKSGSSSSSKNNDNNNTNSSFYLSSLFNPKNKSPSTDHRVFNPLFPLTDLWMSGHHWDIFSLAQEGEAVQGSPVKAWKATSPL